MPALVDEGRTASAPPKKTRISQYRNFFAVRSGVRLGAITEADARKILGLKEHDSLDEVDVTTLSGYEDESPFAALLVPHEK